MNSNNEQTDSEYEFYMFNALGRIAWGKSHISKLQDVWQSSGEAFLDRAGTLLDDRGVNIYTLQVNQFLHSATRSLQAVAELVPHPMGPVPIEQLLRGALLYSFKALYVLHPENREERNARAVKLFAKDRWEYEDALWEQRSLLGEEVGPRPKRPRVASESKMLKDCLDCLVAQGNCECGKLDCPQYDLNLIRLRTTSWWRLYSAVVHGQLWHVEASGVLAPSESTVTTGNLALAMWDISWLYQQAVGNFLVRYNLGHLIEPFVPDWHEKV
ncbi:hypothetical protein [Citricoccus zhacaiensis]|uniref:hypothetical protein n=2 Tax=Citricoccus TaxID=169133 RepID=UPI003CFA4707